MHPHTGEAGAIGAAMETLRVVKRKGKSTFIGIDAAIDLEYTTKNDEETVCHFCPNDCKRTFIDTKRPDGSTSRYIAGFSLREGHRRERRRRCSRSSPSARRSPKQFPNIVDYESKQAFLPLLRARADAGRGRAGQGHRAARRASSASRRVEIDAPVPARHRSRAGTQRRKVRIGIPRVLNLYSTAPFFRTYFEALGIPKQNVVFSDDDDRGDVGRGRQVRLDRPVLPEQGRAGAHPPPALPRSTTRGEDRSTYIFFPILTHVHNFVADTMDNASCPIVAGAPDVMKAAFTKEVDFFATRGIEYLDPALVVRRADAHGAAHVRDLRPAPRDHRGRERPRMHARHGRRSTAFENDLEDKGRAILETVEAEDRVAILMIGRPYHSDPGPQPRHPRGVPGARLSDPLGALDPQGPRVPRPLLQGRARGGHHQDARSSSTTSGRRTTRSTARRRSGRRASRRATRTWSCSTSRRSSAATTRRPTGSSTPSSTRARRRTPRCTTSTPTSRAARSRSASRPTPTRSSSTRSASQDARKRQRRAALHASTRSASSCSSCEAAQLAARQQQDPAHRGAARGARASASALRGAGAATSSRERRQGARQAREEDRGRRRRIAQTTRGIVARRMHTNAAEATNRPACKRYPTYAKKSDDVSRTSARRASTTLPIVDIDAELKKFEEEERKRLGLDEQDRAVGRGHGRASPSRRRRRRRSRSSSAASRWRTTTSSRAASAASATTCRCWSAPTTRRSRSARSSATAASATRRTSPSATS